MPCNTLLQDYVIATAVTCNNTVRPLGRVLQGLLQRGYYPFQRRQRC